MIQIHLHTTVGMAIAKTKVANLSDEVAAVCEGMVGADSLVVVKQAQLCDDIRQYEIVLHDSKDSG